MFLWAAGSTLLHIICHRDNLYSSRQGSELAFLQKCQTIPQVLILQPDAEKLRGKTINSDNLFHHIIRLGPPSSQVHGGMNKSTWYSIVCSSVKLRHAVVRKQTVDKASKTKRETRTERQLDWVWHRESGKNKAGIKKKKKMGERSQRQKPQRKKKRAKNLPVHAS